MGSVWRARHEGLGRDVAVKLLSGRLADDDTAKKRFEREATSAMQVQSEHVVRMLGYGIADDGRPYLVMELLEGEDLEARLLKGPLPPRDAVEMVKQVGAALQRAHEQNILHRDIKPANVFLEHSNGGKLSVKLVDFGFAKKLDRLTAPLTEEGMVVGTPQYMSPEQMTAAKLDARSDLFSLGSVAFEAFTGRRAFAGNSLREVADAVHKRALPLPTHVNPALPRALNGWFSKACARDRDDRFNSADEMVRALEQAFSETDTPATERAPEAVRATGGPSEIVWLVVFLAAAGLAYFLVARGP
jgi:serine/threonine-protein kinase